MLRILALSLLLTAAATARAELPGVLHWEVGRDLDTVYLNVYNALEENRFYIVFEPNIGKNLAGFAEHWGKDYNRNGLTGIRSMVFCSAWYANAISNVEPQLLSLCPLHITLYEKAGTTSVVFSRPVHTGAGSRALELLRELESEVAGAIEAGVKDAAQEADGGE